MAVRNADAPDGTITIGFEDHGSYPVIAIIVAFSVGGGDDDDASAGEDPAFGEGVIIDISGTGDKAEAVINFPGVGQKQGRGPGALQPLAEEGSRLGAGTPVHVGNRADPAGDRHLIGSTHRRGDAGGSPPGRLHRLQDRSGARAQTGRDAGARPRRRMIWLPG